MPKDWQERPREFRPAGDYPLPTTARRGAAILIVALAAMALICACSLVGCTQAKPIIYEDCGEDVTGQQGKTCAVVKSDYTVWDLARQWASE